MLMFVCVCVLMCMCVCVCVAIVPVPGPVFLQPTVSGMSGHSAGVSVESETVFLAIVVIGCTLKTKQKTPNNSPIPPFPPPSPFSFSEAFGTLLFNGHLVSNL